MPKSFALLNHIMPDLGILVSRVAYSCFAASLIIYTSDVYAQSIMTNDVALAEKAEKSLYGWLPKSEIPSHLHDKIPSGCQGLYIQRANVATGTTGESIDTLPLIVEADEGQVVDGNHAVLSGDVRVSHGNRSISAQRMSYERATDTAKLEEKVTIRQPGMRIQGEFAQVSTTQNKANFDEATFVLHESQVRGGAESVKQVSETKLELHEGHVTSCEPGDESWVLEGEKLTIDRATNQGTGKNVKLKIGPVPVFYLPYITFPVGDKRQTGFLFPSIKSSDDGGLDIAIPYYWNLAPNYDATLTPRFISGRGTMLELETRYLNKWMRTETGLSFLPNDDGSQDPDLDDLIEQGQIDESQARPNKGEDRWLARFWQKGGTTDGWYTNVVYNRVSDEDYFRDLGSTSLSESSRTYLEQSAEVGYQFDHWRISTLAQSQQVLLLDIDTPYRKLPQIDILGRYNFSDITLSFDNRYTQFKQRESRPDRLEGQRFTTDYRLHFEKRSSWGFFVPELGIKSLHYHLEDDNLTPEQSEQQISLATPQASLDLGLIFEHAGGPYTQTLEPRMFYLYRRFEDHSELFNLGLNNDLDINFDTTARTFSYGQLYRDSRFIGGDRLDDANQATIGLTSRWENNNTGRDLFTVSVGQIFHFEDRRVTLAGDLTEEDIEDSSEFASELQVNLGARTQLYANAIYDTESRKVNRGSAGVHFASTDYQKLFNISYSYLRDLDAPTSEDIASKDIDQVDVSFTAPINRQWSAMGKVNYDFQNKQELETFLGFEYNDCCYRLRFLARRWLDSNIANLVVDEDAQYDQGIFFEIHFKGLGGSGAKVNSILNDGIFGYETREKLHR